MRLDKAIAELAHRLSDIGIETASLDARLLAQHAIGLSDTDLLLQFDRQLTRAEQSALEGLAERRLRREPVAHILGEREFWGLSFKVSKDVLVPRPDSETLIEAVLAEIEDRNASLLIADIGTGSGCLLLSLLSELPHAYGVGLDVSMAALDVARENALRLGFDNRASFARGNYLDAVGQGIDILISNPPYLAERELADLESDVANYDPHSALVSGPDGLEAYRELFSSIRAWERKPSIMAFEFGYKQGEALLDLAASFGFGSAKIQRDIAGRDRVLLVEA